MVTTILRPARPPRGGEGGGEGEGGGGGGGPRVKKGTAEVVWAEKIEVTQFSGSPGGLERGGPRRRAYLCAKSVSKLPTMLSMMLSKIVSKVPEMPSKVSSKILSRSD